MKPEDLEAVFEANDVEGCIAFFAGATEGQRRVLAKVAAARLRAAISAFPDGLDPMRDAAREEMFLLIHPTEAPRRIGLRVARSAVLATATFGELKKLGDRGLPSISEDAIAVFGARRPTWLREWAEMILSWGFRDRFGFDLGERWWLVRRLVRDGLCERPRGPQYIQAMNYALCDLHRFPDARAAFLTDPGLLQEEVWELFEMEPMPRLLSLHWGVDLAALAGEGRIDRDRLLGALFGGLERDYREERARWFVRIHHALQPTLEERAGRAGRYLGLLASRNASTVAFALRELAGLDRAGRVDPGAVVEAVGPALLARTKGTVLAALDLLGRAADREPGIRHRAAVLAVDALVHESPAVQGVALDLIERLGDRSDPALGELLRARVGTIAASQRGRLAAWLGPEHAEVAGESTEGVLDDLLARARVLDPGISGRAGVAAAVEVLERGGADVPAVAFSEMEAPRLDPDRAIVPVADVDELIALASAIIERPDDPDEIERLLDGVSRLCDRRLDDFAARTCALRARAEGPSERVDTVVGPIRGLVLSWVASEPRTVEFADLPDYLMGFHGRRVLAIARRAAGGQAAPLLSAPTHRGGWIDPRVLVDRVKVWARLPFRSDRLDGSVALLRLAPDPGPRAEALRAPAVLPGPYASALRHALGGDGEVVGPDVRIWVAAARARAPREDDPLVEARHPGLGPDAGRAARCSLRPGPYPYRSSLGRYGPPFHILREPPPPASHPHDLPTVMIHDHRARGAIADLSWIGTLWPIGRESFFAAGLEWLLKEEGSPTMARMYRGVAEALLDPDVPLGPMAMLTLGALLSARSPELHGLAVDALIAAVDDGRVDGPLLGEALRRLLAEGLAKRTRLARTLSEAARISPLHARVVKQAVQMALVVPDPAWRDFHLFLELLKELLIESGEGLSAPGVEEFLRGLKVSGKTAGLIRDILDLEPRPDPSWRAEAAARALSGRLDRARRWLRCGAGV